MATYRAIGDSEVAVDAPITQQLVQALRDNILAVQEGDSTAPVVTLPTPTAGNNIVAMDRVNFSFTAKIRTEFISQPIFVRKAGTYRVFILGELASSRDGNSFFDLNKFSEGNFLNRDVDSTSANDNIHVDGGDNALGATKILDGIEADASGAKEVGISADVTLAKNDAVFMTCSFDSSTTGSSTFKFLFGLAVANEPLTYTGAGLQLNTSTVKFVDEYERFIGLVGDGANNQRIIIRS